MISEFMSFGCSDSYEKGIPKEKKCFAKFSDKSPSGSKEIHWKFQSVKCLGKLVEQYDGRKSGGREAEFEERIRQEWASLAIPCRVEGVFVVSDWSARPYLKVANTTWKLQSSSQLPDSDPEFRKWAEIPDTDLIYIAWGLRLGCILRLPLFLFFILFPITSRCRFYRI